VRNGRTCKPEENILSHMFLESGLIGHESCTTFMLFGGKIETSELMHEERGRLAAITALRKKNLLDN